MSGYGDAEPEDAWHPGDAPAEQIENLARRLTLVDGMPPPRGTSLRAVLEAIAHRADVAARRHRLTERDRLRLVQIVEDLELVRSRL